MGHLVESKEFSRNFCNQKGTGVTKRNNENVDQLLRRFKKRVKDSGIIESYNDKRYYTKPSIKKRLKRDLAIMEQKKRTKQELKEYIR